MRVPRPILITILLLSGCQSLPPVAPHRQFRIVGYVRGRADINAIGAKKLTHINYAFAKVNPLGEIWFEDADAPAHIAQLQALKAVNPDLKIIVSVGGWGADFFSDAALDEGSRCRFATSAIAMVKRYALDGIDLDWEYPGQPGPGIRFRPEDRENFTLTLKTLREELDLLSDARHRTGFDRYTLTIASAGGRYFEHTEMDKLHRYLDWINIMTYDFAGGWSATTGHHTPLRGRVSAESFVKQHLDAGIPARKIVVGTAFYGRGWRGAFRGGAGLNSPWDQYEPDYPWSKISRLQGLERRWDESASAPYLWDPAAGLFISFDDPQSLAEKARFVRKLGLGGIMYWEHSHDPREELLDAIVRGLR